MVIYFVELIDPWRTRIEEALLAVVPESLVISHLVRPECLVKPFKTGGTVTEHAFLRYFARCETASIRPSTFELAAHIRADHGLKTPDAIHLATALEHGCDELWTNDDRFARAVADIVMRQFA